jgi:hypothetical protein
MPRYKINLTLDIEGCPSTEVISSPEISFPNPITIGDVMVLGKHDAFDVEGVHHEPLEGYTTIYIRDKHRSYPERSRNKRVKHYKTLLDCLGSEEE